MGIVVRVIDEEGIPSQLGGHAAGDGFEVEEPIGDMYGENSAGAKVFGVDFGAFGCEQVHGDGVAAEGIHGENIELLTSAFGQIAFEHDSGITELDIDGGL